jgi:uncharacterized protein with GYD domain
MAKFLVQVAYTPQAWASLAKKPQNRVPVVAKVVESLGGKLEHGWLCLGDYDTVVLVDLPDNVSAAAFAVSIASGGACKGVKTTPLLSVEEGMEAMRKAGSSGYQPPA